MALEISNQTGTNNSNAKARVLSYNGTALRNGVRILPGEKATVVDKNIVSALRLNPVFMQAVADKIVTIKEVPDNQVMQNETLSEIVSSANTQIRACSNVTTLQRWGTNASLSMSLKLAIEKRIKRLQDKKGE